MESLRNSDRSDGLLLRQLGVQALGHPYYLLHGQSYISCSSVHIDLGRERTQTFPVRMPEELHKRLKESAEKANLPMNTLLERIMSKYTTWGWPLRQRLGLMVSTIEFLETVMSSCSDENLIALGQTLGKELPEKIIAFRSLPVNLETVVESYAIFINHGGYGEAEIAKNDMRYSRITVHHDLGMGWSTFNKSYLESMFKTLLDMDAEVQTTKRSFTAQFPKPRNRIRPT